MKEQVTYYSPGTFFAEQSTKTIEGADLQEVIKNSIKESKKITERFVERQ